MKASHKLFLPQLSIIFLLFSLALANVAQGQAPPQETNNTIDSGSRSGMRVDPSTLALGFQLSLGNYPGRAGSSLPSNISYSSKVWRIEFEDIGRFGGTIDRSRAIPRYAEHSASGWTTNFDIPHLEELRLQSYDYLGAAICIKASCPAPDPQNAILYVYRILAHMPDGSTHELRRDDTPVTSTSTGNVYTAVDGSRIRYDESNQTLYLPDGSRYVYATNSVQYIDRNGNTLTYNPGTKQWSDTLGRTVGRPPLATGTTGYVTYTLPGVAGSTITYRLRWRNLSEVLTTAVPLRYKGDRTWESQMQTLSPSLFSSWQVPDEYVMTNVTALFNPVVLNEVELPNGRRYTFTYNEWGEIDKVVYPTGGYERYVYGPIDGISTSLQRGAYAQANRGVVDRWVSVTGDGSDEAQNHWHYSATHNNFTTPYTVTMTAPDGSYTKRLLHGGENSDMRFGFDDVRNGMAYGESSYSSSGQVLRRTLTEWTKSGPLPGGEGTATRDPRVTKTVEIILDTGGNALTKTTSFAYDADLNRISTNEYGYVSVSQTTGQTGAIGSISAGTLLRTSEATYLVNDPAIAATTRDAYRARNLLGLPTSSRIKNAAGSIVAQSSIGYDEAAYPLLTYGTLTGWTDPATTVRGNVTTTGSWLNTTGAYVQTHAQYDQCGSVRKTWDARDTLLTNPTQVTYLDGFSDGVPRNTYAFPTSITTAVPDPSGQYGSTTALVSTSVYDFTSGAITSSKDANNQITTTEYAAYDVLGNANPMQRPTRVNRPDGSWSAYGYSDQPGNLFVLTRTSLDSSRSVDATRYFDGLGRVWRSTQSEGVTSIFADTQFDSLGRVWKTSNPYRSGEMILWTTTGYDSLSRVVSVTTPDSAVVTTTYSGNTVTVEDQADKQRKSVTDALGRLKEVYEAPNDPSYNYLTSYSYDALDNLTTVSQGVQTRMFVYDSLKRLTSAMNPESGTICYGTVVAEQCQANGYDANGNLIYKTDARGVLSTHAYDALNRNTSVVHTNDPGGTPAVYRYYDGWRDGTNNNIPSSKGRLWQSETSGATGSRTTINSFDPLGRPLSQSQQFYVGTTGAPWSQPYTVSRTPYNLAGAVTSQTYPSGRSVSYTYDTAGRTNSFTGKLGDGADRTYSTGIIYSPMGGMAKEQFGTDIPLYNKQFYNVRGQLAEIRLGTYHATDGGWWNRGAILNVYSANPVGGWTASGPDNNGNLRKQMIFIPNTDDPNTGGSVESAFFYDYDPLNRVYQAREVIGEANQWVQYFNYDRYGNRTIHQTNTWEQPLTPPIPKPNFEVQPGTNRLFAPGDLALVDENQRLMQYDAAGNLKKDTYKGAGDRVYDAENRMTSAGTAGTPARNLHLQRRWPARATED